MGCAVSSESRGECGARAWMDENPVSSSSTGSSQLQISTSLPGPSPMTTSHQVSPRKDVLWSLGFFIQMPVTKKAPPWSWDSVEP